MILLHRFHPRHRGLIIIARDICVFVRTFVRYARLLLLLLLLLLMLQVIIDRVVVRGGGFVVSRGILWWEAHLFQEGLHVAWAGEPFTFGGSFLRTGKKKEREELGLFLLSEVVKVFFPPDLC